jgi:transketolase
MTNLNDYTIKELEEAIEIKKQIQNMIIPKMVDHPSFDKLQKCCEDYIQEVIDKKVDTDTTHDVFECAIEAYYGKDIFKWVNERTI